MDLKIELEMSINELEMLQTLVYSKINTYNEEINKIDLYINSINSEYNSNERVHKLYWEKKIKEKKRIEYEKLYRDLGGKKDTPINDDVDGNTK